MDYFKTKLNSSDAPYAIHMCLNGILYIPSARVPILKKIFKALHSSKPTKYENELVSQALFHLEQDPKLTSNQLVKFANNVFQI